MIAAFVMMPGALAQTLREQAAQAAAPVGDDQILDWTESELRKIVQHSPLPPVPIDPTNRVADDPAAAHFGQYLFFDSRFSVNNTVSCATCHDPKRGFSNAKPFGEGVLDSHTERHAQSLWNVAYNRWYYWAGSVDTIWSQALKPIEGHDEMRSNRLAAVHLVARDDQLRAAYENIFGQMQDISDVSRFPLAGKPPSTKSEDIEDPLLTAWKSMTADDQHTINTIFVNLGKTIAAYERKIISRDSPFDRFVENLLNKKPQSVPNFPIAAQRGLRLFIGEANCRLCHVGPNFTDGEFHSIGLANRDGTIPSDAGRFAGASALKDDMFSAAGRFSDAPDGDAAKRTRQTIITPDHWGQFKTPSLRNVATSAPYMHQGHFDSLDDVLHYYSTLDGMIQIGHHRETILQPLNLTDQQRADLIAFLQSLTGKPLNESLLDQPESPTLPESRSPDPSP